MILRVGKHSFLYIHGKKTPIVSYFHRKHSLSKYILRRVLSQLAICIIYALQLENILFQG